MKKVIILCILSTFMSTNMFGMLTKTARIKLATKNFKAKKFCATKKFNYDEIILQLVDDNNHIRKEIVTLEQKVESLLALKNIKEQMHAQETIVFRSNDRRSSSEE